MDKQKAKDILPERFWEFGLDAEELRLRKGLPPGTVKCGVEKKIRGISPVEERDIEYILNRACRGSMHSYEREISRGFVTAEGGIRIGVCGTMGRDGGAMRDVSSLCIRFPRQVKGCGGAITAQCAGSGDSIIVIAPPGAGKTTLLRELVREASGFGNRVAVCDERGEISAMSRGQPGFDLGDSTDVLCSFPKAEGMMLLLRSMSPQVIAVDEISAREDVEAVLQAAHCGVRLFATAHARNVEEFSKRPLYRLLAENGVFDRAIVISLQNGQRRYEVTAL